MKKFPFTNAKFNPDSVRSISVIKDQFGRIYVRVLTDCSEHLEGWDSIENANDRCHDLARVLLREVPA